MADKTVTKKILVVDDEADIRWSLKEFLLSKEQHTEVVTAASGEEALAKLAKMRIDLVITDIKMPGMSGLELLVEIKNRFPYISVIVMTAYPSSEYERESQLKGGMYFVEKPFDIKVLREKVSEVLRESGQFRGMLSGISLGDLIQIKCMSGVTAALRVTEGSRQGVIFFHKGDIIHALCDKRDGEEAFYDIISFSRGHLDTINVAELPNRSIFKPYAAMLIEGARRLDEQGSAGSGKKRKTAKKPTLPVEAAIDQLNFGQISVAFKDVKRPLTMAELLASLKRIEGYRAAAIIRKGGEFVAQDAVAGRDDLRLLGPTLHDFFRNAREATGKVGLESCHEAVLWTHNEMMVMSHGGGPGDTDDSLVLAVFGADGNQAQGRREMRKVVARLKAATA